MVLRYVFSNKLIKDSLSQFVCFRLKKIFLLRGFNHLLKTFKKLNLKVTVFFQIMSYLSLEYDEDSYYVSIQPMIWNCDGPNYEIQQPQNQFNQLYQLYQNIFQNYTQLSNDHKNLYQTNNEITYANQLLKHENKLLKQQIKEKETFSDSNVCYTNSRDVFAAISLGFRSIGETTKQRVQGL